MQIKENRPDAARSGYSVGCKPFGRIAFQRTIRTRRLVGSKGLQLSVTRTVGLVRYGNILQVGQDSAEQNPLESTQSQLHSTQ